MRCHICLVFCFTPALGFGLQVHRVAPLSFAWALLSKSAGAVLSNVQCTAIHPDESCDGGVSEIFQRHQEAVAERSGLSQEYILNEVRFKLSAANEELLRREISKISCYDEPFMMLLKEKLSEKQQGLVAQNSFGASPQVKEDKRRAYAREVRDGQLSCEKTGVKIWFVKADSLQILSDVLLALPDFSAEETLLAFDWHGTLEEMKKIDSEGTERILNGLAKSVEKVVIAAMGGSTYLQMPHCQSIARQIEEAGFLELLAPDFELTPEACTAYNKAARPIVAAPGLIINDGDPAKGLLAYMRAKGPRSPEREYPKHIIFWDDWVRNPYMLADTFCNGEATPGLQQLTVVWYATEAAEIKDLKFKRDIERRRFNVQDASPSENSYFHPDPNLDAALAGIRGLFIVPPALDPPLRDERVVQGEPSAMKKISNATTISVMGPSATTPATTEKTGQTLHTIEATGRSANLVKKNSTGSSVTPVQKNSTLHTIDVTVRVGLS